MREVENHGIARGEKREFSATEKAVNKLEELGGRHAGVALLLLLGK